MNTNSAFLRGILFFIFSFWFFIPRSQGFLDALSSPEVYLNKEGEKRLAILLLNLESFMCFSCLDSFLEFYSNLESFIKTEEIWIITILSEDEPSDEKSVKIIEKKLGAFLSVNNIKKPFLLDRFRVLNQLASEGNVLLVLDESRNVVKKYSLPLSESEKEEILGFFEGKR